MCLREDSSPVGEVDREGRSDVAAVHSRRTNHPDAEGLLDVVAEGQASHTRPGSRVLTSCRTQPLRSGSLKFADSCRGDPAGRVRLGSAIEVIDLAHVDAATDQLGTRRGDVGDHEEQPLRRAGRRGRDAFAERDRAP